MRRDYRCSRSEMHRAPDGRDSVQEGGGGEKDDNFLFTCREDLKGFARSGRKKRERERRDEGPQEPIAAGQKKASRDRVSRRAYFYYDVVVKRESFRRRRRRRSRRRPGENKRAD